MLRGIEFTHKRFDTKDDDNLLCPITENIIILCNNANLMRTFATEIVATVNDETEYNNYDCDDEDVGNAKLELDFGLQKVININGQKITLALEPAMIYRAKQIEDIWFLDWAGHGDDYREKIYPMTVFKGSREKWNEGLDAVYRMIVGGRYGCYDGRWTNLRWGG